MKRTLEKTWWWRRLPTGGDQKTAWLELDEFPAFRYELARRLFTPEKFPLYVKLERHELDIVRIGLAKQHPPVAIISGDARPLPFEGYSTITDLWWNLNASDHSLIELFKKLITQERAARGIRPPKRNEWNLNRGPSWTWLELMDRKTGLDECERSHLSQARKAAEKIRPKFLLAWEEIHRWRRTIKQLAKENPSGARYSMERVSWPWLR